MIDLDATDAARTLTYRFLDLAHIDRLKLAQDLGIYTNEDEGLFDAELFDRIFERAEQQKLLERLWDSVEAKHGDGQNPVNPYVGR